MRVQKVSPRKHFFYSGADDICILCRPVEFMDPCQVSFKLWSAIQPCTSHTKKVFSVLLLNYISDNTY